jgi:hypothetical protein
MPVKAPRYSPPLYANWTGRVSRGVARQAAMRQKEKREDIIDV